jgi:DNA-binding CsgD family transcriptional regulator
VGYLGKLRELSLFRKSEDATLNSFLDFLAQNTLEGWGVDSLFVSIVRANGGYYVAGGHGAQAALLINGFERHFDRNSPGANAYFDGRIEECGPFQEYPFYGGGRASDVFPNGFDYSMAIPVPSYGPLMVYCHTVHDLDRESENFLYALGETLSWHLDALGFRDEITNVDETNAPFVMMALTPRQWEIHGLMLDGFSNLAIAHHMKYSESLIRQETMRIYKKLGITGRKDLPITRNNVEVKEA